MHKSQPLILTGSFDGLARIWNRSGETIATLGGHSKAIKSVHWLRESRCVTGGHDQKLIVHEFHEAQRTAALYECVGHKGSIECIQSLSNRHYVRPFSWYSLLLWILINRLVCLRINGWND